MVTKAGEHQELNSTQKVSEIEIHEQEFTSATREPQADQIVEPTDLEVEGPEDHEIVHEKEKQFHHVAYGKQSTVKKYEWKEVNKRGDQTQKDNLESAYQKMKQNGAATNLMGRIQMLKRLEPKPANPQEEILVTSSPDRTIRADHNVGPLYTVATKAIFTYYDQWIDKFNVRKANLSKTTQEKIPIWQMRLEPYCSIPVGWSVENLHYDFMLYHASVALRCEDKFIHNFEAAFEYDLDGVESKYYRGIYEMLLKKSAIQNTMQDYLRWEKNIAMLADQHVEERNQREVNRLETTIRIFQKKIRDTFNVNVQHMTYEQLRTCVTEYMLQLDLSSTNKKQIFAVELSDRERMNRGSRGDQQMTVAMQRAYCTILAVYYECTSIQQVVCGLHRQIIISGACDLKNLVTLKKWEKFEECHQVWGSILDAYYKSSK